MAVIILLGGYRYFQSRQSSNTTVMSFKSQRTVGNKQSLKDRDGKINSSFKSSLQRVSQSEPIFKDPGKKETLCGTTNSLVHHSGLVKILQIKNLKRHGIFFQISQTGKTLGWVNAKGFKPALKFILPYQYCSQFYPSPADDACELAALKMVLSVQGKATNVNLRQMVQSVPRSNKPWRGYTHNPYRYGSHAELYPNMLVKCAKSYGASAKDITGFTKRQLIQEIQHGNGIVVDGAYMMKKPGSVHSISLLGYKPGYFYFAEPFARHPDSPKTGWVQEDRAMRIFGASIRNKRAMVVD